LKIFGTRKEDGIPLVGIKVLRKREKRLLLTQLAPFSQKNLLFSGMLEI